MVKLFFFTIQAIVTVLGLVTEGGLGSSDLMWQTLVNMPNKKLYGVLNHVVSGCRPYFIAPFLSAFSRTGTDANWTSRQMMVFKMSQCYFERLPSGSVDPVFNLRTCVLCGQGLLFNLDLDERNFISRGVWECVQDPRIAIGAKAPFIQNGVWLPFSGPQGFGGRFVYGHTGDPLPWMSLF
ncbi:hypothetical protein RF11_11395 [Thelohanellus kitauei]|uniref:Uncharacterized protein n=1 Tax=Thelohanellus kitauei TaxID=669202 RepID=A0A0C2NL21_THEKT|nr:hypothetical protein RF11_11395 [Thelohanellus kitauei]